MPRVDVTSVLVIIGLRGEACRARVTRLLEAVEGVRWADVCLCQGIATIGHDASCELERVVEAVMRAGYCAALVGCESRPLPMAG
jgi:copper chaperone CopZ